MLGALISNSSSLFFFLQVICYCYFLAVYSSALNFKLDDYHMLTFKVSCFSVSDIAEEDVLQAFFEERKLKSDFISKTSDMLWQRAVLKFEDVTDDRFMYTSQEGLVQYA